LRERNNHSLPSQRTPSDTQMEGNNKGSPAETEKVNIRNRRAKIRVSNTCLPLPCSRAYVRFEINNSIEL